MQRRSHLLDRPTELLERAGETLGHPWQSFSQRPRKMTGGLIALILVALGVYWMLPEIRRYLRIERM
ncbi:MAG: hypothetical protein JWO87_3282 [Phycisphaerales bacterium]|jgi:hypothetical protein|nr:hypothetical protein [Phycisphaerales bacterium]MDB5301619.1 hypothetical protein [Phycisphaerales bacterium]